MSGLFTKPIKKRSPYKRVILFLAIIILSIVSIRSYLEYIYSYDYDKIGDLSSESSNKSKKLIETNNVVVNKENTDKLNNEKNNQIIIKNDNLPNNDNLTNKEEQPIQNNNIPKSIKSSTLYKTKLYKTKIKRNTIKRNNVQQRLANKSSNNVKTENTKQKNTENTKQKNTENTKQKNTENTKQKNTENTKQKKGQLNDEAIRRVISQDETRLIINDID